MKIYLLVILLFFIFYLAYNFKEGFDVDDGTILFKPSYDINTYCKDTGCKVVGGRDSGDNSYIKNKSNLMPFNISSPFVINFYNMLKNCKLNSNCFSEKSKILKENNVNIEPTKDGYLNFICDKDNIQSIKLNNINNIMEERTNDIERPDIYPNKSRVEIENVEESQDLNGELGTVIPFSSKIMNQYNDKKYFENSYRISLDKKPNNYDNYKQWCDSDTVCSLVKGVTSDEEDGTTIVLKKNYLKNISGRWWNPSILDTPLKDPDKNYLSLEMIYDNLITMARAANDDKKEVCKCIGNKMFEHVNKYTINGSSNDAINIKDKLNIETCN
tara:strand:+ start:358 stop:1344 length:987 start_codon:yes stop_codon:yes gene_type:complete